MGMAQKKAHETNKSRDEFRYTHVIPNSWQDEDGMVMVIPKSEYDSVPRIVEIANDCLKRNGQEAVFTSKNILPLLQPAEHWINPAYIALEHWPASVLVRERKEGWIKLYIFDPEEVTE